MEWTALVSSLLPSLAVLFAIIWAVITSWRWRMVWQYRHVPGTSGTYIPLIGDLVSIAKEDLTHFVDKRCRKFPKAYKMWMGPFPWVVIVDVELARKLLMRYVDRPNVSFLAMRRPQDDLTTASTEVFINGDPWRIQRRATEGVVLHAKSLSALVPFVSQVTAKLVTHLDRYAASGEPLDVQEAVWMMTIDAVGWAAFGVDLRASESHDNPSKLANGNGTAAATDSPGAAVTKANGVPLEDKYWEKYPVGSPEFGRGLVNSARRLMKDMDMASATVYTPLNMLLPELSPVWRCMAKLLPDAKFLYTTSGHEGLAEGCKKIIQAWEAQQAAGKQSHEVSSEGLLARVLSGGSQEGTLKEHEILGLADNIKMFFTNTQGVDMHIPQVAGTVIAGFETTGTSIAMGLYLLATHPEAQARAQKEVDDVLQGKDPVLEDLEQLPYINGVFQEATRLYAPGSSAIREVRDDTLDLGNGMIVPKGTRLFFPTFTYMRDPAIWPHALEFLPERHIQPGNEQLAPSSWNAFIPFGHGSRLCVGYKFATMESRMALARMMQRFTFETVPGIPPPNNRTSITYKPDEMVLRVIRRQ